MIIKAQAEDALASSPFYQLDLIVFGVGGVALRNLQNLEGFGVPRF
jgi:hypothetical protein